MVDWERKIQKALGKMTLKKGRVGLKNLSLLELQNVRLVKVRAWWTD